MHPIQEKLLQLAKIRNISYLSYREIGRQLAETYDPQDRVHPTNVKYHLEQLVKDGHLQPTDMPLSKVNYNKTATSDTFIRLIKIPVYGAANCGPATLFADDKIEGHLELSSALLKSKNYNSFIALRASGKSMNRAEIGNNSIDDGDYVIVDTSKATPRNGETVVIIRDGVANIKRIFFNHEDEVVVLKSESDKDFSPIVFSPEDGWDGLIGGTVIQVVKTGAQHGAT